MPVNLKDVAKALNLSAATVSRALNNQGRISPQTREKVLKAVEEMNYHPNEAARMLRDKNGRTIGIIVPDIGNEFFARIIKGAERTAWREEYSLLVMSSNGENRREKQTMNYMLEKRVSGVILDTVDIQCPMYDTFLQYGIPIVFVDNLPTFSASFNCVSIDNERSAFQLVSGLTKLGHRRIAIFNYSSTEVSAVQRQMGYMRALDEAGIQPILISNTAGRESARQAAMTLMSSHDRPTAVFAVNNDLAYGVMDALRAMDLSVPGDVSLCCFDALDSTGLMIPQLTSVIQPAERFGELAVRLLIRRLSAPDEGISEKLLLDADFQSGTSIAPPAF